MDFYLKASQVFGVKDLRSDISQRVQSNESKEVVCSWTQRTITNTDGAAQHRFLVTNAGLGDCLVTNPGLSGCLATEALNYCVVCSSLTPLKMARKRF